jgi:ketosteroid isomerase-like protein
MSRESVEIMRRGYARFVATGELDPAALHPDFVWDMSTFRSWPERQQYTGVEGTREFLGEWTRQWEDWKLEVEDYLGAGDRVVVILRQTGRARISGVPVDMRFAQVWTLKDGKQIRMQMYATPEEALEAVGLSK